MARLQAPKNIRPELIEAGDVIAVTYPAEDGVTMTRRGRVAYVQLHAGMRILITQEGSVIARLPQSGRQHHSVTLIEREPVEQTPLPLFA